MALALADEYLSRGDRVAVIHGPYDQDNLLLPLDVHRAVHDYGIDNTGWTFMQDLARFIELLGQPGTFALVVLDNPDAALLNLLLPRTVVATVVTSRHKVSHDVFHVRVGEMTTAEAELLVAEALPDAEPDGRGHLVELLGCRPLPLRIATRLIASGAVDLASMIESLRRSASRTLTAAEQLDPEHVSEAIVDVYRQLLTVCDRNDATRRVLDMSIWMIGSGSRELLASFLVDTASPSALLPMEFDAAISFLDALGVIEVTSDIVVTNTLTWRVLRELTPDRLGSVFAAFHRLIIAPAEAAARALVQEELTSWGAFEDLLLIEGNAWGTGMRDLIAATEHARLLIEPSRSYGLTYTSPNVVAVWQDGFDFFAEPVAGERPQFGIVTFGTEGPWLWGEDSNAWIRGERLQRVYRAARDVRDQWAARITRVIDPAEAIEASKQFESELQLAAAAAAEAQATNSPPPVPPTPPRTLDRFLEPQTHTVHHDLLSNIPEATLRALEMPAWSLCGALVHVAGTPPSVNGPQCELCDFDRTWQARPALALSEARKLLRRMDEAATWRMRAQVFDVIVLLSPDASERRDAAALGLRALPSRRGDLIAAAYGDAFDLWRDS